MRYIINYTKIRQWVCVPSFRFELQTMSHYIENTDVFIVISKSLKRLLIFRNHMRKFLAIPLDHRIPSVAVKKLNELLVNRSPEMAFHQLIEDFPSLLPFADPSRTISLRTRKIRLEEGFFAPDFIYAQWGSRLYDIAELKQADKPIIRKFSSTHPASASKAPIYSTYIQRAFSQLRKYNEMLGSLSNRHIIRQELKAELRYPKLTLIAGRSQNFLSEELRRELASTHPSITLLTWDDILEWTKRNMEPRLIVVPSASLQSYSQALLQPVSSSKIKVTLTERILGIPKMPVAILSSDIKLYGTLEEVDMGGIEENQIAIAIRQILSTVDLIISSRFTSSEKVVEDVYSLLQDLVKDVPPTSRKDMLAQLCGLETIHLAFDTYGMETLVCFVFNTRTTNAICREVGKRFISYHGNDGYGISVIVEKNGAWEAVDWFPFNLRDSQFGNRGPGLPAE